MKQRLIAGLWIIFLLASCSQEKKIERPREVWAIRSVLDTKPRMLSIALNEELWVAYNTQTAGLYKAWTGGIKFDGPVYTSAHGPQPTSQGVTYFEEAISNPWRILQGGLEITPKIIYKGHVIRDNKIALRYNLIHEGRTISVEERPEFVDGDDGKVGFERRFSVSGLGDNEVVQLHTHINSVLSEDDIVSNGKFEATSKTEEEINGKKFSIIDGVFRFNNGDNTVIIHLTKRPQPESTGQKPQLEEAVLSLIAKSDCNTCHNRDVKTVGPAYIDIAKRYTSSPQEVESLVAKIIKGGSGNWGDVAMTPHPALDKGDAATMVNYILGLDSKEEKNEDVTKLMPKLPYKIEYQMLTPDEMSGNSEQKGIAINVYQFEEPVTDFPEINAEMSPVFSGKINAIHLNENDFGQLKENFVIHATGTLTVRETTNVVIRLVNDDGARLFVDGKLLIDNGGSHGLDPKDAEFILKSGKHSFRLEYFQGSGGKGLSWQWMPHGKKDYEVIPPDLFTFKGSDIRKVQQGPITLKKNLIPGDGSSLVDVHPSFALSQARPDDFKPKVAGLDFLPDGRLVVTTWDSLGSVYLLDGVQGNDAKAIQVKRIAGGLAEPLGVKVVDGEIYVLQKQELTRLVDLDKDDIIDEYQAICNGWRVSANFHEFAFGLLYKDGFFYGTLATAINPGGASTKPQIPDRGKVVKISKADGSFELIASGLRTPNGINFGVDNEIFIADNQGDWLPASKIVHLVEGAWYGSRSVDFEGTANATEKLPVVWLPQDEIGNSPSQPAPLNVGPYQNQMIHGEVTHGGIKRVYAEKINGQYQGAVFRFTQGLEAGINRLTWGPDSALYSGGIGSTGNWGHYGKLSYGLQRLKYNGKITFEMLAVKAKPKGIEIVFTEPLKEGVGTKTSDYMIRQWRYQPTSDYGGPKLDEEALQIKNVRISADRRSVMLELDKMKPRHVVYVRLNKQTVVSSSGQSLWATEAWYTMNEIPQ
jgi:cytochrome c